MTSFTWDDAILQLQQLSKDVRSDSTATDMSTAKFLSKAFVSGPMMLESLDQTGSNRDNDGDEIMHEDSAQEKDDDQEPFEERPLLKFLRDIYSDIVSFSLLSYLY